ncbi:MAG TPA: hypothetical protein VFZ11_10265 [Gemmatimonadaceae bacterium]
MSTSRLATLALALPAVLGACATGSTFRSGVGDAHLERAPYYAGQSVSADAGRIAHVPVVYQRGGAQSPIFDPEGGPASPVAALLRDMNAYLDSLGVTTRITAWPPQGTPPDVQFGCATDGVGEECAEEGGVSGARPGGFLGSDRNRMRLAVGRPSPEWVAWEQGALADAGASRALVLTLEVGQYWPYQANIRGSKEIELGTNHVVGLPWLTAVDAPVSVLQITGALMDSTGLAIRIGAEGLVARRTGLLMSGLGAQALISDEDVEAIRTARRENLPGQPLTWQVALRNLVAELTGRGEIAVK